MPEDESNRSFNRKIKQNIPEELVFSQLFHLGFDTRSFYSGGHTRIETCTAVTKLLDRVSIFHIEAPQAQSNELILAKQVLLEEKGLPEAM